MFYERLKSVCELAGTNITAVAVQHLGVTSSTPTGWKRGAYPRADIVIKAAQHFGVSSDYLLGLTDETTAYANNEYVPEEEREIQDIAAVLRAARPATRAAAIASVRSIVDSLEGKKGYQTSCHSGLENEAPDKGVV